MSILTYDHSATVTSLNTATGARDDFGQPTTAAKATTLYNGYGDYQDMSFREVRDQFGTEHVDSAGWFYFPEGLFPTKVRTDNRMCITGDGITREGVIVHVDRLSNRVLLRVEHQPEDV